MSVLTRIKPRPSEIPKDRDLTRWFANAIGSSGVLTDYWYKPGIPGTFTAYMQNGSAGTGIISSTAHATKGFVYLGSSTGLAFDETNTRVGLVEATPQARLHMTVPEPSGQIARLIVDPLGPPNETIANWSVVGSAQGYLALNDSSTSNYLEHVNSGISSGLYSAAVGAVTGSPSLAGWTFKVIARINGTLSTNPVFPDTLDQLYLRKGARFFASDTAVTIDPLSNSFQTFYYHGTGSPGGGSWSTTPGTFTLEDTPAGGLFTDGWAYVQFSGDAGVFGSSIQIAYVELTGPTSGGSPETLQRWQTVTAGVVNDLDYASNGGASFDLALSGNAPVYITAGDETSGVRWYSDTDQEFMEVGLTDGTADTLTVRGYGATQGTQLSADFANTTLTGTVTINGGSPAAGRVLESTNGSGLGTWANIATLPLAYVLVTTTYAILTTDGVVDCIGTFTVTLPTAVGVTGRMYDVKNSGTGTITMATTSNQTIDGETTFAVPPKWSFTVISTGSNWDIV